MRDARRIDNQRTRVSDVRHIGEHCGAVDDSAHIIGAAIHQERQDLTDTAREILAYKLVLRRISQS